MVPRVMHVAGGEKKEGEGFVSREVAAWIFRREVLTEMARKKKSKNPRCLCARPIAAIRFTSLQSLP